MTRIGLAVAFATTAVAATVLASPAHADRDTDFAAQLHTIGIYGQRDYNAWLAKIMCKRLHTGLDPDAYASADFLAKNLPRGTNTDQTWRFLSTAIDFYCPDQVGILHQAAEQGG